MGFSGRLARTALDTALAGLFLRAAKRHGRGLLQVLLAPLVRLATSGRAGGVPIEGDRRIDRVRARPGFVVGVEVFKEQRVARNSGRVSAL
ncbi:MAG: hypothetical protein HRU13_00885 [Phycisphaerales bacterium]|nr:hypothetical protein [Phycisphaerales bacterium]